jgi:hypothetical protein
MASSSPCSSSSAGEGAVPTHIVVKRYASKRRVSLFLLQVINIEALKDIVGMENLRAPRRHVMNE